MVIFNLLIFYIIIIIFIYNKKKIEKNFANNLIWVKTNNQILVSCIICFSFILIYFIIFKLLKIFTKKNNFINVEEIFENINNVNLKLTNIILILFCLILVLRFVRFFIFLEVKFHYLRLHYYFFLRNSFYLNIYFFFKNFDLNVYKIINSNFFFKIYYFSLRYGFKIFFVFDIFYGIIFNDGFIYVKFLPYYGLYYFIYRIYDSLRNFESDFDRGIVQVYYPNFVTTKSYGKYKLNLYKNKLLFSYSDFLFVDSIIYKYEQEYPKFYLFNFSWQPFYSGIDIYEIAKFNKPIKYENTLY